MAAPPPSAAALPSDCLYTALDWDAGQDAAQRRGGQLRRCACCVCCCCCCVAVCLDLCGAARSCFYTGRSARIDAVAALKLAQAADKLYKAGERDQGLIAAAKYRNGCAIFSRIVDGA